MTIEKLHAEYDKELYDKINELVDAVNKLENQHSVCRERFQNIYETQSLHMERIRRLEGLEKLESALKEKTSGLTFDQAIIAWKSGKTLIRKSSGGLLDHENSQIGSTWIFLLGDLVANDWEVVE